MSEPSSSTASGTEPTGTETQTETSSTQPSTTPESTPSLLNTEEVETKAEGDPKATPEGAPEAYADFKLPEGVALAPEALTKATELFKGLNLPQAGAQSLVDFYVSEMQRVSAAPTEAFNAMQEKWIADVKADPEVGSKLPQVKANIGKAYDALVASAPPEKQAETRALITSFREAMDLTGVGNHPAFVKLLNRFAERIIEPGHVSGANPSVHGQTSGGQAQRPSLASSMYPTNP